VSPDGARRRRRLIEQKGNGDIALASQTFCIEPFGLPADADVRCATINHIINDGVQIVIVAVWFVGDALQVFRLHQLKLITDRRDNSSVAIARVFDKIGVPAPHMLFNHATPINASVRQISVPFVVIISHVARL
jgi:hypothetical protein